MVGRSALVVVLGDGQAVDTIPGRFDSLGAVTDDEAPPPTAAMHSDPAGLAPSETTKNSEKEKEKKRRKTHTHARAHIVG
jgi:hypothetical protein